MKVKMKIEDLRTSKLLMIIKLVLVYYWIVYFMKNADSLVGTTFAMGLIGTISIICFFCNNILEQYFNRRILMFAIIFSLFFSFAACLANYSIGIFNNKGVFLLILGGMIIGYYSFCLLVYFFKTLSIKNKTIKNISISNDKNNIKLFLFFFLCIALFDLFYYFTSNFPGTFTPDSYGSISQCLSNTYSDHHPFWFTVHVKMALTIGFRFFHSITAGYVIFFVFQICFIAFTFALGFLTILQIGAPMHTVIILLIYTIFMPYNFIYSSTLWKDIPFGISVLLVTVALFRNMTSFQEKNNKSRIFNRLILLIGLYGSFIYRNNGWYAMSAVTLLFFVFYRKKHRNILICMITILILTFVMKNPVEHMLNISPTQSAESLSIPIQQIGYVINYEDDLSDEEYKALDHFFTSRENWKAYNPNISDPLKVEMKNEYTSNHMSDFLKLWLKIGLRHPKSYIKGWISQTRGYWNSGYNYWRWATADNNVRKISSVNISSNIAEENKQIQPFASWFAKYISLFEKYYIFHPLLSIGMWSWWMLAIILINYILNKRYLSFVGLPCLFSILTLLIATPVFSEFRYAYCLFTTMPIYMMISMYYNPTIK